MFWDEKKQKLVEKCPDCSATFIRRKGANCSLFCKSKKIEDKHQQVVLQMIDFYFKKIKIIVKFPERISAKSIFNKKKGWGWTNDIKQIISIPWYTLRSKKEFFDTIVHEIGHITAFEKKFNSFEKKILGISFSLWEKYKHSKNISFLEELKKHDQKFQKIIDKYREWDGHDYEVWYQEYLRFFDKFLNSPKKLNFKKYAYGNFKPIPYDKMVKSGRYKSMTINNH